MSAIMYYSADLSGITTGITISVFEGLTANVSVILTLGVVLILLAFAFRLLTNFFKISHVADSSMDLDETETEEPLEEIKERNEYEAVLQCQNCGNIKKIPIVKGYNVEEAIRLGDYFCTTCGSHNLKKIKGYWE